LRAPLPPPRSAFSVAAPHAAWRAHAPRRAARDAPCRWEFSAPQWHDFSGGEAAVDDGADAWFETAPGAAGARAAAGDAWRAAGTRAPGRLRAARRDGSDRTQWPEKAHCAR
jgi:hypothetical protein